MRPRPPQSATSRHYAEPIQATGGAYDELDGDYDLAGRDSNDVDEGYVHRVRPRRTSDMSISVQGPAAPQRVPAPPYVVSRDKPRRAASPLAEFAADPLAAMRHDDDVDLDAEYDAVDDFNDDDGYAGSPRRSRFSELGDDAQQPSTHGPNARAAFRTARQVVDDQPPTPRSGGSVEKKVSWAEDDEETKEEKDATTIFHAELDVDFRETKDRCDAAEAAAEYAEELAAETAHAMDTVLAMAQGRIDEAHSDIDRLEKELAAEKAARRAEQEALLEELVQARRLLVAADKRAGDSRSTIRDERHLDDAIQRLSLLQWLGDGEGTGHNQVEGPPTLSGPVESYASPEHRRQQAQARRAAAARVAAQREDSSDLAPEPVWKSNVAAHLRNRHRSTCTRHTG